MLFIGPKPLSNYFFKGIDLMRVNSTQNTSTGQNSKKVSQKSSSTFSLAGTEKKSSRAASTSTNAVSNIDALLALQNVDDIDVREKRRRAIKHGEDILSSLENLKISLLSGQISQKQLMSLKQLLQKRPEFYEDSQLKDILDHIDMRAQIELAKRKII